MLNPLSNPSYLLPPLVVSGVCLILIAVVLRDVRRSWASWIFCGLLLSVAVVSLLLFVMRTSPDAQQALIWVRIVAAVGYTSYVLYYHFTLAYTGTQGQRRILLTGYLLIMIFASLSLTDLLVKEIRMEYYGYAPTPGLMFVPLSVSGLCFMGGGAYNLLKYYRASYSPEERNRIAYLLIAVSFPVLGAFLDTFSNLPPASIWGNLLFCIICTIAIVKYHLLDIRVVVRKSLVYLLVSLIIAIPYVSILYLLHFIFQPILELWWVHLIIILLLAIALRPLYSWAQNFVDRLFYRDRYNYLKALQHFTQKAQSVINLEELSSTLTQLVSGALRTSSVCLLLPSESDSGLITVSSAGLGSPPSGVVLRGRSPLIKWLKLKQRILSSEELNIIPQLQSLSLREKNNLKQMEAELYVPIQASPAQLSGILVLGQKLSQQSYSSEDEQLLTALSSQMAIALENARLYAASQQEVAERKQAEEALGRQKAYFQQLFDNSPDAIILVDTADRIVDVNKGFETLFGYRANEIKGQPINDVIVPEDRIEEASALSQAGFNSKVVRLETARKRKDDSLIDVAIVGYPIRLGNETVGGCAIYSDITERKRAEEKEDQLQQELYESGRLAAIGELAAGVAHEINNPLTAILGFSQRVLRKSHNKSLARDLERISGEALRAARIVQNLLTFARRREPKKEDCDTNDILRRALELRAYELKTSNISLVTDLAPGLPRVRADSHQIQEVFLNVVLNSEQAMVEAHQAGTLAIKTCKNKGYVQIVFSDDGPGIVNENLHRIFLPFFSTRADKGGTGLGLSICHGIVTEHGGKIHAKSRLGEGTTFVVELPVATGKTKEGKAAGKKSTRKVDRYHQPISGS